MTAAAKGKWRQSYVYEKEQVRKLVHGIISGHHLLTYVAAAGIAMKSGLILDKE